MGGVHASILEDANVVRAAVRFDEVVVRQVNVVVVDVDGGGAALGVGVWRTVCGDANAVVKVGDRVVGDDMAGPIDLNGKKAAQLMRRVDSGGARAGLIPADEAHLVFAAQEKI